jgi:transposase
MPRAPTVEAAAKKKSLHDSQRDTPRVRRLRNDFAKLVRTTLAPKHKDLRFLDEFGLHLGLTRQFGRASPGQRIFEGTPDTSGPHYTVIASLGWDGVQAPWMLEGAMTSAAFATYLEQILVPTLPSGAIVLMDNLSAHKGCHVRALLERHGAKLEYLPPYSPDWNPIEKCWSKVKTALRSAKARTLNELLDALSSALNAVTPDDADAWYTHCGYTVKP